MGLVTNRFGYSAFEVMEPFDIKKYFDETYGIKQNVAKETNKSKYDLL